LHVYRYASQISLTYTIILYGLWGIMSIIFVTRHFLFDIGNTQILRYLVDFASSTFHKLNRYNIRSARISYWLYFVGISQPKEIAKPMGGVFTVVYLLYTIWIVSRAIQVIFNFTHVTYQCTLCTIWKLFISLNSGVVTVKCYFINIFS